MNYKLYAEQFDSGKLSGAVKWFMLSLMFVLVGTTQAQNVSLTATAGTATGSFPTMSAAFTAINAGTHRGVITLTVTVNTTEPSAPTALASSGTGSASYTSITIRPQGNRTITSAGASSNRGVLEFSGADNITIDGDDPGTAGTRNLTISVSTQTTNIISVVRLNSGSTAGTNGATNCVIRNCNIIGARPSATSTVVSYGIHLGDYSTTSSTVGGYSNSNITIDNNQITRCYNAIWATGASATFPNSGYVFSNNIIGSATSAENIGSRGIILSNTATSTLGTPAQIFGNDIRVGDYGTTGYIASIAGIEIGATNFGIRVFSNNIHDVAQPSASGYGAYGIFISSATNNTLIYIYNNFIRDIYASNYASGSLTSTFVPYGIFSTQAITTGLNIDNNTIVLSLPNVNGTSTSPFSACVGLTSTTCVLASFRNNILVNRQNSSNAFTVNFASAATANGAGTNMDRNCYNTLGANLAYIGASRSNLTQLRATTGKDVNSYALLPNFVSSTDLHITATGTPLESGGETISYFSTDFDGQTRPGPTTVNGGGTAWDIGADEFDAAPVTVPTISTPTINPTAQQCISTARTITVRTTAGTGNITSVTATYSINGVAQTPITLTGGSATGTSTWTGTIPVVTPSNATVTWVATVVDQYALSASVNGVTYNDDPLFAVPVNITSTANPNCSGSRVVLRGTVTSGNVLIGTDNAATKINTTASTYRASGGANASVRSQYLILASELTAAGITAGNLKSVTFRVASAGTATYVNMQVDIASTTQTTLTSAFTGTFTTVHTSPSITVVAGNNTHVFQTPYFWDGTSNLIVQTCVTTPVIGGTCTMETFTTGFAASIGALSTSGCAAATSFTTVTGRPVMGFSFDMPVTSSSWSDGTSVVSTLDSLVLNPTSSATYTYTISAFGCSKTSSAFTQNVTAIPAAITAGSPSTQCGTAIPTVSVSSNTGAGTPVYRWYDAATAGTLLQSGTSSTFTSQIATTTTFYVSELLTGCESPRVAVQANVNRPDSVRLLMPAAICSGNSYFIDIAKVDSANNHNYTYNMNVSQFAGTGIFRADTVFGAGVTYILPTANGRYTFTLVAIDSSNGCTSRDTSVLDVYQGLSGTASSVSPASCSMPNGQIVPNVTGAATVVNNDFTSSTLPSNMTSAGNDFAIVGGQMRFTTSAASKNGGVLINNPTGLANNDFQIDFDMITTAGSSTPADGFSYSYGPDVVALPTGLGSTVVNTIVPNGTENVENGSGTGLKLSFDAFTNGANAQGVYLMYNCPRWNQASTLTPADGLLFYSNNVAWRATATTGATTRVNITIDSLGRVSLRLNGVLVASNIQLPASYLSANKASWKHAFGARTGASFQGHFIDNLSIKYNNFYEYSIDGGGTWVNQDPILPPSTGTYNVQARYISVPSCSTNLGTVTVAPTTITASATTSVWCAASTTRNLLTFTPSFPGATVQWQESPAGANTWTTVATTVIDTINSMLQDMDYRVIISCGGTPIATSNVVSVLYSNPQVLSVTPGSRCNAGSVQLSATGSGSQLYWSTTATGTPIDSGVTINTPSISSTTNFFVRSALGGTTSTANGGNTWNQYSTTGMFQTTLMSGASMIFDVLTPITLRSVDIYPSAAIGTSFTIEVRSGSATGTLVASYTGVTTVQNSVTPTVAQTVPVNFSLPAGTNYYIGFAGTNPNTWRTQWTTSPYPFTVPGQLNITASSLNLYIYYFYNFVVGGGCSSTATAVPAYVVTPPTNVISEVTPFANCTPGNPITFNVAATNGDSSGTYWEYQWSDSSGTTVLQPWTATNGFTISPSSTGYVSYRVDVRAAGTCSTSVATNYARTFIGLGADTLVIRPTSCSGTGSISVNNARGAGGLQTLYSSNFTSAPTWPASFGGNTAVSNGRLNLTDSVTNQSGWFKVGNPSGIASGYYKVQFDLNTTGPVGSLADGISYSFGDDLDTVATTPSFENGTGTKFKLAFDAFSNAGGNVPGVYLMYNCNVSNQAPTTTGVLAYSSNVSWIGSNRTVTVIIDAEGKVSVQLGDLALFTNVQLPASYLTSNRATWYHVFKARTGAVFGRQSIDNLSIQYQGFEYSITGPTGPWQSNQLFSGLPQGNTYDVWMRNPVDTTCMTNVATNVVMNLPSNFRATSTSAYGCVGGQIRLSMNDSLSGATYVWQFSTTLNGTYTDISTPVSTPLLWFSPTQTGFFRCVIMCGGTPISGSPSAPLAMTVYNALSGNYTIGIGGSFATITDAVAILNCAGVSGATVFELTNSIYNAASGETFPIILGSIPGVNASNTVTFRPYSGNVVSISGDVASGSIVRLNGSDFVTFDGSNSGGTDRSMSFTNTNGVGGSVIQLISQGANLGATNNTFRNLNITTSVTTGATTAYGIAAGGSTIASQGADNDNLVISNNNFSTYQAVFISSLTTAGNVNSGASHNITISGNNINFTTTSTASVQGISLIGVVNATVERNSIAITSASTTSPTGIILGANDSAIVVNRNLISRVITTSTSGYGGRGIVVGTGITNSNILVSNNVIYNVNGSNFSSFSNSSAMGIGLGVQATVLTAVTGGVSVLNNSVNMYGTYTYAGACSTAAIYVGNACTLLDLRNNIFVNSMANTNTTSASSNYAIFNAGSGTAFTLINNNTYFVSGTQGVLAYNSTASVTTLAAWRTATGSDAASVSVDPRFVSNLNLTPNAMELNNTAASLASVTVDYNGFPRISTPDMGAIEFGPAIRTSTGDSITSSGLAASGSSWIHYYDASGRLMFSLNPNGNNLGTISWGVRITNSSTPRWSSFLDTTTRRTDTGYVANRNFYITPTTQPTTPVSVRLYYTNAEVQNLLTWLNNNVQVAGGIDSSKLYLTKFSGNRRSPIDLDPTNNRTMDSIPLSKQLVKIVPTITNWGPNAYVMDFNVSSFSEISFGFAKTGNPIVLPVEMISFTAISKKGNAELNWITAQEKNNNRFDVQRSVNGTEWVTIGSVLATTTPSIRNSYSFTDVDAQKLGNVVYYRLNQVDNDGKSTISTVRSVRFNGNSVVSNVFPNPTKDVLNVFFNTSATGLVKVTDMYGRLIETQLVNKREQLQLNLETLPQGIYNLEVLVNGQLEVFKFVKQ